MGVVYGTLPREQIERMLKLALETPERTMAAYRRIVTAFDRETAATFENARTLQLAVSVQGLIPRGLARTLPQLAGLESLDVQLWGDAKVELSSTGEILGGTIGIDMAPGRVLLPWLGATPLQVDGGHLALSYDRAARP